MSRAALVASVACVWCDGSILPEEPRIQVGEHITCGEACAKRVRERVAFAERRARERGQFGNAMAAAAIKLRDDQRAEDMAELSWAAATIAHRSFATYGDMLVFLTTEKKRAKGGCSLTLTESNRLNRTLRQLWQQGSAVPA